MTTNSTQSEREARDAIIEILYEQAEESLEEKARLIMEVFAARATSAPVTAPEYLTCTNCNCMVPMPAPAGDVVERVSEAISDAEERTPGGVCYRDRYDIMARAAIEAMPAGGVLLSAIGTLKAALATLPATSVVGEENWIVVGKLLRAIGMAANNGTTDMGDTYTFSADDWQRIEHYSDALIAAGVINGGGASEYPQKD